jgi:hypothetical protein
MEELLKNQWCFYNLSAHFPPLSAFHINFWHNFISEYNCMFL